MGGKGTYSLGKSPSYTYKTVGYIDGVKIINPIDETKALKLPEEMHSSKSYVLLDKNGVFHQYREYDKNHEVVLEIGYHYEPKLGKGDVLHIHAHSKPGISNHPPARLLTDTEKNKYKNFFIGVPL